MCCPALRAGVSYRSPLSLSFPICKPILPKPSLPELQQPPPGVQYGKDPHKGLHIVKLRKRVPCPQVSSVGSTSSLPSSPTGIQVLASSKDGQSHSASPLFLPPMLREMPQSPCVDEDDSPRPHKTEACVGRGRALDTCC